MTPHALLIYAAKVIIWSSCAGILVTLAVYILARVHCPRRPPVAVRGRFRFARPFGPLVPPIWRYTAMPVSLDPGQSTIATINAFTAANDQVPSGPVSFIDPAVSGLTLSVIDDTHCTYTAAPDAAPQEVAIQATFQNSAGETINVQDVVTINQVVAPAVRGEFAFTAPTP